MNNKRFVFLILSIVFMPIEGECSQQVRCKAEGELIICDDGSIYKKDKEDNDKEDDKKKLVGTPVRTEEKKTEHTLKREKIDLEDNI